MIYRKQGSVVRWENGTLVRVTESGIAIEDGELFTTEPLSPGLGGEGGPERSEGPGEGRARETEREGDPSSALRAPSPLCGGEKGSRISSSRVLDAVDAIRERVRDVPIERLIVSHGIAEHEYDGRTWTEETERFHLSLVHGPLRALVDSSTRRLDDLAPIAEALERADANEREAPKHVRVAPCVAAALLPLLRDVDGIVQTTGGVDGYGNAILEATSEPWPNWYRPSYRMRPVRMPLNVRLECDATEIDGSLPLAIALLAPPQPNAARVLIVDGGRVYPSHLRVTRVAAAARERIWYPYGGGSFGAELML